MTCCGGSQLCDDCKIDVNKISESFILEDTIWPSEAQFLCVGCVEKRIGRRLSREDFKPCLGNYIWKQSKRLKQRFDQTLLPERELNKFKDDVVKYRLNKAYPREQLNWIFHRNRQLHDIMLEFEIIGEDTPYLALIPKKTTNVGDLK